MDLKKAELKGYISAEKEMIRRETAKEIFEWLDTQLFKDNRLWRGETQEVLVEGEKKFLK